MTLTEHLTGVADAIRSKTGETAQIPASQFAELISSIETGGGSADDYVFAHKVTEISGGIGSKSLTVSFSSMSEIKCAFIYFPFYDQYLSTSTYMAGYYVDGTGHTSHTSNSYPLNMAVTGNTFTYNGFLATSDTKLKICVWAIGEPA